MHQDMLVRAMAPALQEVDAHQARLLNMLESSLHDAEQQLELTEQSIRHPNVCHGCSILLIISQTDI